MRTLRRFGTAQEGATVILFALFGAVLLGFSAIGVDGASFYYQKRRQQAATDMAAMAAAARLDQAGAQAATLMASNGFPAAALQTTVGVYTPDPTLAPASRFASSTTPNAVRVVSTTTQPFIFGAAFQTMLGGGAVSGFPIRTEAIARKQDQATFTLGTGLVALDGGLANALLGGLLGTSLSLNLLDYQSLGSASVDLFGFSDALATRLRLTGGTYGSLGLATASQSAILGALADTLSGDARAAVAVRAIAAALPSGASATVGDLIAYGSASGTAVGRHPTSARVSALDLLSAVARLAGDQHLVSIDLGATVPGLLSTQLQVTVGESAAGAAFSATGPEGTTLHSAQVRLLLTAQVGGAGLPAALTLPVYAEVASGTASIATIACASGASTASVTLAVTPGLVDLWIGRLAPGSFGDLSHAPSVSPATVLDLAGVARVTAFSHVAPSSGTTTRVPYTATEIAAATTKTTPSTVSLGGLSASLASQTQVNATVLGLGLPLPGLPSAVSSAIAAALTPIDGVLARTLALLGVSVGTATTAVPGVRCGQGQLVN